MRIVFLQSSLWLSGGARVIIEHCNLLAKRGHQVSIVIPKDAIDPEMASEISDQVTICQAAYPLIKPLSLWDKLRLTSAMVAVVPKCDVLVATHTPTTLISLLAGRMLRKGIPVWFYMDYPGMFEERPSEAWLLEHAMTWHRGAVVLSCYSEQELRRISHCDVRFIGNAISHYPVFSSFRQYSRRKGSKKQIMYLGDFRPRKGLADFLKAVEIVYQSLPGIELLIVLKEDGEIATSVPFHKVLRPGLSELAECYAGSDVFVSASWHEGFGMPPLEAMACGTPVVLTDSGGVRDYSRPGENCLMVPPMKHKELAAAIQQLLLDPALVEKFRQNGPLTAQEYTWDKVADRMENALMDFINQPPFRAAQ